MCKHTVSLVIKSLFCSLLFTMLGICAIAQTATPHNQKKQPSMHAANPLNKTGRMSMRDMGMGKNDSKPRWAAAIRHADRRAEHIRKHRTEVK
jgi:hypothetical protein